MSSLAKALETEIARAARSEVEKKIAPLKLEIAALKKALRHKGGRVPRTVSPDAGRPGPKRGNATAASARLTPASIRNHRKRLGLSQAELALLAGVTPVAVYFWESGRTKPRGRSVEVLSEIRKLSPKQARSRADQLR